MVCSKRLASCSQHFRRTSWPTHSKTCSQALRKSSLGNFCRQALSKFQIKQSSTTLLCPGQKFQATHAQIQTKVLPHQRIKGQQNAPSRNHPSVISCRNDSCSSKLASRMKGTSSWMKSACWRPFARRLRKLLKLRFRTTRTVSVLLKQS